MLLFAVALVFSAETLPPVVGKCYHAVDADAASQDIEAACSINGIKQEDIWGQEQGGLNGLCLGAMTSGQQFAVFKQNFSDQPQMVAGVRKNVIDKMTKCWESVNVPQTPLPRKDVERLWN